MKFLKCLLTRFADIIVRSFSRSDCWLCRSLPGPIRLRWSRLWIRENEFHPSLDSDAEYYYYLPSEGYTAYWQDLVRRREIAHRRSLAPM